MTKTIRNVFVTKIDEINEDVALIELLSIPSVLIFFKEPFFKLLDRNRLPNLARSIQSIISSLFSLNTLTGEPGFVI